MKWTLVMALFLLGASWTAVDAHAEPPGYGFTYPGLGDIHTSVNPIKPGYYYSGWSKGWLPGPSPTERYYASGHYQALTWRHNTAAQYIQSHPEMSFHEKMSIQAELYPNLYGRYVSPPREVRRAMRRR